jgi:hypothetical protein
MEAARKVRMAQKAARSSYGMEAAAGDAEYTIAYHQMVAEALSGGGSAGPPITPEEVGAARTEKAEMRGAAGQIMPPQRV